MPEATANPSDRRVRDQDAWWLVLLWVLVVAVAALEISKDIHGQHGPHAGSLLTPAPALAAIRCRPRQVAAISLFAFGVAVAVLWLNAISGFGTMDNVDYHATVVGAVVLVGGASVLASRARERRQNRLTQVQRVAEAAQFALLPPVPQWLGELRLEARYVAAEAEARIGGDLYEVAVAQDHVRLIIGDVRGKGLPAVRAAAGVLGAFREAAFHERRLAEVAARCSEAVRRLQGERGDAYSGAMIREELFVTAAVMEIQGERLRAVNLGHPRPLLLTRDSVRHVGTDDVLPPLGLVEVTADDVPICERTWEPGDRLVLYTDGIEEARDAEGRFFPLVAVLEALLDVPTATLPDVVIEAVDRHTGQQRWDDAALVVVEWGTRHH